MKLRYVHTVASVFFLTLVPGMAVALGGANSSAPPATSVPENTASTNPATPQQPDVAACTTPPGKGEELVCSCAPGGAARSVWGTGPFTADSDICTAARFSGAIGADGGLVRLTGLPGMDAYSGGTANGITTRNWGRYGRSFAVAPVGQGLTTPPAAVDALAQCTRLPAGTDSYACSCQASATEAKGSVWGSDPFTADSSICAAALLTGYIVAGEPASVHVLRIQGLEHYAGTTSNGVTSRNWGRFDSSFVFDWNK